MKTPPFQHLRGWLVGVLICFGSSVDGWAAQSSPAFSIRIAAGDAAETLNEFARQTRLQVIFPVNVVRGIRTHSIDGRVTALEGLEMMLRGTGLRVQHDEKTGAFAVSRTLDPASSSPVRPKSGTIEGRVYWPATGEFVERARIRILGTTLEAFTDAAGFYRLTQVPAGRVRLQFFFTGIPERSLEVDVASGATVHQDFTLSEEVSARGHTTIKLADFVVASSREMTAAARAINERRFAPNLKDVVATDEFGDVAEGNVAEFMKFLPGVNIDFVSGNARDVSLQGVSSDYVPITLDGFSLASAVGGGDGGTGRAIGLDQVSINNLSRIEVEFSPTPESQGTALAGSVNLVPRSSFERTKPLFSFSSYVLMRDNARDWEKTPGPLNPTRKIHPGGDFSYIAPLSPRFGFTLSGGFSRQYSSAPQSENSWRGSRLATNGGAFPHTTPDRPYLSGYSVSNAAKETTRSSLGGTIDYQPTPNDRLSFSLQGSTFDVDINHNELRFNVGRVEPGNFTTTSTHGTAGAGLLALATTGSNRTNWTYMSSVVWRHNGPIWKTEAGAAYSRARNRLEDFRSGHFATTLASRRGVTIAFDDIYYLRPGRIAVTDLDGTAVDPYSIGTYTVDSATGNARRTEDAKQTAVLNVKRDFLGRLPLTVKSGLDFRAAKRDLRTNPSTVTFIAPDRSARPFLDESFSSRDAAYGFPKFDGISSEKFYAYFQQHPEQFATDPAAAYRGRVNNSKYAREIVSAAYARFDFQLFANRLKLVTGVRAEQTNISAAGPLIDPSRNVLRDAQGNRVMVDGNPIPISTDPLRAAQLTPIERGARTNKEYLNWFPSINASLQLRENLIARGAWSTSIGRPNFNQYAGGLTLPDPESPAPDDRIIVNNAGIRPWHARAVQVRLEYYFEQVGQISIGAFRRDFDDFFGATSFLPSADFLALYGLDPATYGRYPVLSQYNVSTGVRTQGINLSYKQALTFLPEWARGVQIFANGTTQRLMGPATTSDFSAFVPRTANWGVHLARDRFTFRANWNFRDRRRRAAISGPTIEPGTFSWWPSRVYLDLNAEYYFYKRFGVFALLRNAGDTSDDIEDRGPSTPADARFRSRTEYGSLWMFGIKGTF